MDRCRKCGIELREENWYPSFRITHNCICKGCLHSNRPRKITHCKCGETLVGAKMLCPACKKLSIKKKNRKNNVRRMIREKLRPRYCNDCGIKLYNKRNGLCNECKKNHVKETVRKHNASEGRRRRRTFRAREMGYTCLNTPFVGSEGHHIDQQYVIYIPKDLHKSIVHNHQDSSTMELINYYAIEYLFSKFLYNFSWGTPYI